MSREIKFRAWKPIHGRMFDCSIVSSGEGYESWRDFEDGFPSSKILMQYTGLKDKYGKEIYEGDIVARMGFDVYYNEVRFNQGMFELGVNSPLYQFDVEVVGNIYENPELLEVDK